MMEKVKVTVEQANGIESCKTFTFREVMQSHLDGWVSDFRKPLNKLTTEQFASALLIGYEVEEYESGDWVVDIHGNIGKIEKVEGNKLWGYWDGNNRMQFIMKKEVESKLTPEEIKAEQERRVWAKIGREPNEWKLGDIYKMREYPEETFKIDDTVSKQIATRRYNEGRILGIYPAESFISFGGGEDE